MTAEAAITAAQPGPAKSPRCQQLIDLRAEHPMPYAQISAKLGISAAAPSGRPAAAARTSCAATRAIAALVSADAETAE
jgi:hypothetical protein